MTEEEWETCTSAARALQLVNRMARTANAGWRRKFRLFGCYALRRLEPAADSRFGRALDVAERHFDGAATAAELRAAVAEAQQGYEVHRSDLDRPDEQAAQSLGHLLVDHPYRAAYDALGSVTWPRRVPIDMRSAAERAEQQSAALMGLVRDLFGNPFRPVAFDPEWRTSTVVALARGMYNGRDFAHLPILADALEDAGCDHPDVIGHCRDPHGAHVRGCWVVDGVLGLS